MAPLTWQQNTTVFDTVHHLQTQHGPALATLGTRLYMVYVGDSGSDLWYAWIDTGGSDFSVWNGNYKIKTAEGRSPKSSYKPAIAVFDGILHVVYASQSASSKNGSPALWWAWFDGQDWHGDIKIATTAIDPRPTMAVKDGLLHVVYQDGQPGGVHTLMHFKSLPLDPQASASWDSQKWEGAVSVGSGCDPALVTIAEPQKHPPFRRPVFDLHLFALMGPEGHASPLGHGILPVSGPVNLVAIGAANPPVSDGGESGAVLDNKTYVVYRGQGQVGIKLWYITIDPAAAQPGNDAVSFKGSTLEASSVPGVAVYNGKLCLGYKRDNTADLMFAWATPT